MKKAVKTSVWIVGGLLALLAAAALFIVLTFDPNKYKAEIAAAVSQATGRELTISGDIRLTLFPWLGVELGAMELSNAPGFGSEPFVSITSAAVKVKLLPLLRKEVQAEAVTLTGLRLHLRRDAAGRNNWADLVAASKGEATPEPGVSSAAPVLAGFTLGGINLRDATLVFDDRAKPAHYELRKLNLHTGAVNLRDPVKLDLDFDFESAAPAVGGHLQLTTTALYGGAGQTLALDDLALAGQLQGTAVPGGAATVKSTSAALLDLAEQQYKLRGLKLDLALRSATLSGKQIAMSLAADVEADLKNGRLAVTPLTLAVLGLNATGNLHGHDLLTTARYDGTLDIAGSDLRGTLKQLAITPVTADAQVLQALRGRVQFSYSGNTAALDDIELKLDQTTLKGSASVRDFAKPAVRFQLALDSIDADRYLPPPAPKATPVAAPPSAAAAAGAAALPLATLRKLDVDGKLRIGALKVAKLKLSDIDMALSARDGVIRLYPFNARLYNGRYRGDLRLDARGDTLRIAMDDRLGDIAVGPLSRDVLAKDLVSGTGNVTLQLSGRGADSAALRRTLNGKLTFSFVNGEVKGVNLVEMIQKDYLKYIQGLGIDSGRLDQTVFSKFAASATVTDGDIKTDDLALASAQLNVKGRGSVNLASEQLALRLDAVPTGQFARQLGDFKEVVVPIQVGGTLAAPTYSVDLDQALKQMAKSRLDVEKKKLQDKLQQQLDQEKQKTGQTLQEQQKKLQDKLQNKLKDLFK